MSFGIDFGSILGAFGRQFPYFFVLDFWLIYCWHFLWHLFQNCVKSFWKMKTFSVFFLVSFWALSFNAFWCVFGCLFEPRLPPNWIFRDVFSQLFHGMITTLRRIVLRCFVGRFWWARWSIGSILRTRCPKRNKQLERPWKGWVGWFVGWLVGWLVGSLVRWFVGWLSSSN